MKKYTIEDLRNQNDDEARAVADLIIDGQQEYTFDEMKVVRDKLDEAFTKARRKRE